MRNCARLAFAVTLGTSGLAHAEPLTMNDNARVPLHITLPPDPWDNRVPSIKVNERPIGDLIAVRLGIVNGHAELFRFDVQNAPSDKTTLRGVVDGGGVKLKITW